MLKLSRWLITSLAAAFGIMLGVFVLLHLKHFRDQTLVLSAVASYVIVLLATLFAFRDIRIPSWLAMVGLAINFWIPVVMQEQHIGPPTGDYDTWYITANAILLGAIAVRGYQLLAAIGGAGLLALVLYFGGSSFLPRSGIVGAELLIGSCIAIAIGLQRADADIKRIQLEQLDIESRERSAEAAREEHDRRVKRLKAEALPTLELIRQGNKLSKVERQQIDVLAKQLRDEVSGGRLITEQVARAITEARSRGAEVDVTDQGGSLRVTEEELNELLETAVIAISSAAAGERVRLTAPANESHVLRLTKSRPGVVTPDLDLKLGEGLV